MPKRIDRTDVKPNLNNSSDQIKSNTPKKWETHQGLTIAQDSKHILKANYERSIVIKFLAEQLLLLQFTNHDNRNLGKTAAWVPKIDGLEVLHAKKRFGVGPVVIEFGQDQYDNNNALKDRSNFIWGETDLLHISDDLKRMIKELNLRPTLGQTILKSISTRMNTDESGVPAQHWLLAVQEHGLVKDEEWEQLMIIASRAEEYVRTHLASRLYNAFISLLYESLLDASGNAIPPEVLRSLGNYVKSITIRKINTRGPGRTKGTGLFKSVEDFHAALWDVFRKFSQKPSEVEVIESLRQHSLCQQKTSAAPSHNQTRTLRGWLKKSGFKDFHDAWRKYLLSRKSGK